MIITYWLKHKVSTFSIIAVFTLLLLDNTASARPLLLSDRSYSYDNQQQFGPWMDGMDLGEVHFTLSESVSDISKHWFITGLKLLNAFQYPEARAAFTKAQNEDINSPVVGQTC